MGKAILGHIANAYARVRGYGHDHDQDYSYGRGWRMKNVEGVCLLYHYGTLIAADFGDRLLCTATSASDRDAVNSMARLMYGHCAISMKGGVPTDGGNPHDDILVFAGPRALKDAVGHEMLGRGISVLSL